MNFGGQQLSDLVSDFTSCESRKLFPVKALRQVGMCSVILHLKSRL